jgi:hypothetical protein
MEEETGLVNPELKNKVTTLEKIEESYKISEQKGEIVTGSKEFQLKASKELQQGKRVLVQNVISDIIDLGMKGYTKVKKENVVNWAQRVNAEKIERELKKRVKVELLSKKAKTSEEKFDILLERLRVYKDLTSELYKVEELYSPLFQDIIALAPFLEKHSFVITEIYNLIAKKDFQAIYSLFEEQIGTMAPPPSPPHPPTAPPPSPPHGV